MPRRLPWNTSSDSPSPVKREAIKPDNEQLPVLPSPSRPAAPRSISRTPFNETRRGRDVFQDEGLRSPSTSPPPEPPAERFMIPGPLHDDRYRMVEDEFLNVAHQFTVHLHRAEYNRLKNLAKVQNAAAIREIERPVVGSLTRLARQRQDRARRTAKRRRALGDADGQTDSPPPETGLRGLLESPRKEAKWISAGAAGTATTRAAAGFGANLSSPPRPRLSPRRGVLSRERQVLAVDDETTESSDEDLATPSRRLPAKATRLPHIPSSATSRSTWPSSTPRAAGSSSVNNSPRPTPRVNRPDFTPVRPGTSRANIPPRLDDVKDDDDDPFGIKRRRIQRQQSREQFRKVEEKTPRKEPSPDNIPSFM